MVHVDYRDARPIYAQIIDGFREQIATGVLQPGDKLPSVRELAATLAINPNTIQRSYNAVGGLLLCVYASRKKHRAMPAYEEPPVLPGGSFFILYLQIRENLCIIEKNKNK